MNLMTLLMQKDSNFLRLLKKPSGELPPLDMDLIDELSDAFMSGDVTPLTQLAFAIISELFGPFHTLTYSLNKAATWPLGHAKQ